MTAWLAIHWLDLMMHLALDITGGLTLRCAIGMCEHKRHQYIVWVIGAIFLSFITVYLIG